MGHADAVDPAELAHRRKPGVFIRQAIPLEVGGQQFEVMLDLTRQAILAASAQDEVSET
jgi:hypothetical protein